MERRLNARYSEPSRLAKRFPLTSAIGLMLLWWLVNYGFGALPLPGLQPDWFPHLGVLLTNLLSAAVVLIAAFRLGLIGSAVRPDGGRELAGLGLARLKQYFWLLPLLLIDLGYLFLGKDGTPGISGSFGYLLSAAVGMLAIGLSEEFASRGVPLGLASRAGRYRSVLVLAVVFGAWHFGNYLFFDKSLDETWWQILGTTIFGFCLGAARLLIGSILPLVFLHAFSDWAQLNSPGAAPLWYQIVVMVTQLLLGVVLMLVGGRRTADS